MARAGMDHARQAEGERHADGPSFERQVGGRIVLLTTAGAMSLWDARFRSDDVLLLGSEGSGVPDHVHARADLSVAIPIRAGFRSLDVAVAGGIALAEAVRQPGYGGSGRPA